MTTSFLSKKILAADTKQAEELDKLYKQMRTNSETNRLMDTSFEDAMKRQYSPLVKVIGDQTKNLLAIEGWKIDNNELKAIEGFKPRVAIEGPKPVAMIRGGEDFQRMTNLPRDILEDYMTIPGSEKDNDNGIKKTADGSYMFNNTAVNFSEDRKVMEIGGKYYPVTRGLMEVMTKKSPKEGTYSPEDVDKYLEVLNQYGKFDSLTGNSLRKKWLDKVADMGFKLEKAIKKSDAEQKRAMSKAVGNPDERLKSTLKSALSKPRQVLSNDDIDPYENIPPMGMVYSSEDDAKDKAVKDTMDKISKMPGANKKFGNGLRLMPSNPLSLYKMLDLRLAAYKAGNKGLRNDIIAISDELLRQKVIKKADYKKLMMVVLN